MLVHSHAASRWRTALITLLACTPAVTAMASDPTPANTAPAHAASTLARRLPLTFEQNQGQAARQVNFLSRGAGYTLFLTPTEAVMALRHTVPVAPKRARQCDARSPISESASSSVALHMKLFHGNPNARATGEAKQTGVCNYYIGNDRNKWQTGVSTFGKVRYANVYKGIDLLYYGSQGQQTLEYDFVVKPHSDYKQIALQFAGAKRVSVTKAGDLKLTLAGGSVVWKKPLTYQTDDAGHRRTVASRYVLDRKDSTVRFAVSKYDTSKTLTLDPYLSYSTYFGGSNGEQATGIAVDSAGNVYVTGYTASSDFPTTSGAFQTKFYGSHNDAFVTKLNSMGTALIYSTYLGGSYDDEAQGIAVDNGGDAYITGFTTSTDFHFTPDAFQIRFSGYYDAFLTRLNAAGTALIYSTYLGGTGYSYGQSIALDSKRNVYLAGNVNDTNFPTTANAYATSQKGRSPATFFVKTGTTEYDLMGDNRTALLLQNSQDNSVAAWFLSQTANGTVLTSSVYITTSAPSAWKVVGQADFNGDGHTDLLWQNAITGDVAVWFMNGTSYLGSASIATGLNPWRVASVGDLNGDSKPDIVWRNTVTGDIACWFLKGTVFADAALIVSKVPLTSRLVGLADVNTDGQLDIVFQDSGTHNVYVQYLQGAKLFGSPVTIGPNLPAQYRAETVADLNQDGSPDVVFQNTTTGEFDYWLLRNTALLGTGMIASGVPLVWSVVAP